MIPDFQRDFEWQAWDINELTSSIFRDYYKGDASRVRHVCPSGDLFHNRLSDVDRVVNTAISLRQVFSDVDVILAVYGEVSTKGGAALAADSGSAYSCETPSRNHPHPRSSPSELYDAHRPPKNVATLSSASSYLSRGEQPYDTRMKSLH